MELTPTQYAAVAEWVLNESGWSLEPECNEGFAQQLGAIAAQSGIQHAQEIEPMLQNAEHRGFQRALLDIALESNASFFSGRESFRFFRQAILPSLMEAKANSGSLRFWSAGCATGQEAMSLSMMLEECMPKFAEWDVRILATDIVPSRIERAATGRFCREEIASSVPAKLLKRHFTQKQDAWVIAPRHLERIEFVEHNLLESWARLPKFDLVLMRHVLRNFPLHVQRKVAMQVYQQLEESGYLMLGQTEATRVGQFFEPIGERENACFRKNDVARKDSMLRKWATTQREMSPLRVAQLAGLLGESTMFEGLSGEVLETIAARFEFHEISSGQKLVKQGSESGDFFILLEGTARVCIDRGIFKKYVEVSRLAAGDIFGVSSLISGEPRGAHVISEGPVSVFVGSQALFKAIAHKHETFRSYVSERRAKRNRDTKQVLRGPVAMEPTRDDMVAPVLIPEQLQHLMLSSAVRSLLHTRGGKELPLGEAEADRFKLGLRQLRLFADMELAELDDYLALVEYWTFPPDSRVIQAGDQGLALFMIAEGEADVMKANKAARGVRRVDALGKGQVFGESSLVNLMPESIDVVVRDRVFLFVVGAELFRYVVDGEADVALSDTLGIMSGRIKANPS